MSDENSVTLGEFLRQQRQKQGITIEQVASATKINVRTLQSLEADHYHELPAKPFIRGFVTSYCRFIGLDPKKVLTQFAAYIDDRQKDRPNREGGHSGYAFERREGEQTRTFLWIMMGSCIVLGALMILIVKPSLHRHQNQHVEKLRASHPEEVLSSPSARASITVLASPSAAVTEEAKLPEITPSTEASAEAPLDADPLSSGKDLAANEIKERVKFRANDDVLLRYQVDDKPVMKFVLRKGGTLVLRAKASIKFQCSNPGAITFKYKNEPERPLAGDPNLVIRQNIATVFFPAELSEKIEEPFPGGGNMKLPNTPPSPILSPSP